VVLPDSVIRDELARSSTLFETDLNDATCGSNAHKIGPTSDGKPGGCDNVQITVHGGEVHADYMKLSLGPPRTSGRAENVPTRALASGVSRERAAK
jgi:hypothetical protein